MFITLTAHEQMITSVLGMFKVDGGGGGLNRESPKLVLGVALNQISILFLN